MGPSGAGELSPYASGGGPSLLGETGGEEAMTNSEILLSQLTDPFRLGLIVALVVTMLRNEAVTGRWLPLAAGVLFVAVILPLTTARPEEGMMAQVIALGIVANLVLLALVMGIRHLVLRIMP